VTARFLSQCEMWAPFTRWNRYPAGR